MLEEEQGKRKKSTQPLLAPRALLLLPLERAKGKERLEVLRRQMRLTSQLDNDPRTQGEVKSDIDSDKWFEAMKSEIDLMGSNLVWTIVDPPKGVKPLECKWIYKRKLGADGEVTAFKVRLVTKGYSQQPGVNFEKTYSLVAMAKSTRILLAIAAWSIYNLKQASRSWNTRFDGVICERIAWIGPGTRKQKR
ncbi:UNVERIFIED_CONTAM: hypothetical protein Scaly_2640000 [Sesamum calycinum]|uniref:Reverse transcriptase Ty1/copia-type domain-containing protein n=1 Tax=Sesamum calycinum TaxID=2727403 RepID=A0AAW2JCV3_9LAMI